MKWLLLFFCYLLLHSLEAQRKNPEDFKKGIWYRVNLKEKMNYSFFQPGNELSHFILEGVKSNELQPYVYDSLDKVMGKGRFLKNITMIKEDSTKTGGEISKKEERLEYLPNQLYVIEIKILFFFNIISSCLENKIEYMSLLVPAEENPKKIDFPIASFKFEDVKQLFIKKEARCFNKQNQKFQINFSEALERKFYSGRLIKYENPQKNMLIELDYNKKDLLLSEKAITELMEYVFRYYWMD